MTQDISNSDINQSDNHPSRNHQSRNHQSWMNQPIVHPSCDPDADVRFRIGIALSLRHTQAIRRIRFEFAEGIATLRGKVPTYYERQLAIEAIRRVAGVRRVNDELEVATALQSMHARDIQDELLSDESASESLPVKDERAIARSGSLQERAIPAALPSSLRVPANAFALIVLLVFATLTGCGKKSDRVQVFPVEGQVTFNGQPLANAFVVLHPRDPIAAGTPVARAQTDSNGTFHVSTYESSDGAAVGEYAVTVEYYQLLDNGNGSSEPGPNVLPPRLASPATTEFVARVSANPNKLPTMEVSR